MPLRILPKVPLKALQNFISTTSTCPSNSTLQLVKTPTCTLPKVDMLKKVLTFGTQVAQNITDTCSVNTLPKTIPPLMCSIKDVSNTTLPLLQNKALQTTVCTLKDKIIEEMCPLPTSNGILSSFTYKDIAQRATDLVTTSLSIGSTLTKNLLSHTPTLAAFSQTFTSLSCKAAGIYCLIKLGNKIFHAINFPEHRNIPSILSYAAISYISFQGGYWFETL